jgi:hypothetical protein
MMHVAAGRLKRWRNNGGVGRRMPDRDLRPGVLSVTEAHLSATWSSCGSDDCHRRGSRREHPPPPPPPACEQRAAKGRKRLHRPLSMDDLIAAGRGIDRPGRGGGHGRIKKKRSVTETSKSGPHSPASTRREVNAWDWDVM